jgi:hypothetical protein
MVGLFHLGLLFILVGCAQLAEIEADPHFWPGAAHRLRRVPASVEIMKNSQAPVVFKTKPSISHSEWSLLMKTGFALRDYKLVVRDEKDQILDSHVPPEMIIDGEALLQNVEKLAPGTWKVTLSFTNDQSVVKIGFSQGGHRVAGFRQIHFNLHQVDLLATQSYAFKTQVRADGKDVLRVYLDLRDEKGYSIYSTEDFDIKLHVDSKLAQVEGPFSTSTGPYFRIRSIKPGDLNYHITVDGGRVSGQGVARFLNPTKRFPAAEVRGCLTDLATLAGTPVPSMDPVEAYDHLARQVMRRYEEKRDITPEAYERTLAAFSSEACTANAIWDSARDDAGRALKSLQQRLSDPTRANGFFGSF